jgi:steroid delta-isomerase-like uncharacterized protein
MSQRNIDTFMEMVGFWNKHDGSRAVSFLTEDVNYWDITMPQFVKGREEVRKIFQSFFDAFPNLTFEVTNAFGVDDRLACEWRMRGTQASEFQGINAIGKSIDIVEVSLCTFRDGKISRQVDYFDSGTLLRQLGVLAS